jgi:enoyl-CoA hydratase/carnithine racemase
MYSLADITPIADHTFAFLIVEQEGNVLNLTLNRPDKKNALHPVLMQELAYALSYAHVQSDIWMVVIRAKGDTFCAGADLKAFAGQTPEASHSTIPPYAGEILLGELFNQVHKPCIAVVQGPVYAGGFLIVAGCHYVICSESAFFMLPEVKRGLYPMQVMASLLNILPVRKVIDLCIRAEKIDASSALEIGLATHVVPPGDLESTTTALCQQISENSPTAIRMGLAALDQLRQVSGEAAHAFLKAQLNAVLQTEDAKEGLQAFIDKRKPVWTGR